MEPFTGWNTLSVCHLLSLQIIKMVVIMIKSFEFVLIAEEAISTNGRQNNNATGAMSGRN